MARRRRPGNRHGGGGPGGPHAQRRFPARLRGLRGEKEAGIRRRLMSYTAHLDTFARDNLPPATQWPELVFGLPELQYPARLNCATALLDKPVTRGRGHRIALRAAGGASTYTQLST